MCSFFVVFFLGAQCIIVGYVYDLGIIFWLGISTQVMDTH